MGEADGQSVRGLDLPGHGLSDHKRGPYHFVDWIADALAAADALGWTRFSVLGHSMGAGIASLVAGTMPKRIDRCALIEGLGPLVDEPERAAERLARSLRVEARKRQRASKRVFTSKNEAAERLVQAAKMKLDSARVLVERGLAAVEGGYTWRADPRLRVDSRVRFSEVQVQAFLRAITCPVQLVCADQGWPVDPELQGSRRDAVPTLKLVALKGHHHLHLDDPAAVAAHVGPFLKAELGPGGGHD